MDYAATLFAHNHLYNGMLQTRDASFLTGYYCSGGTLNGTNSQVIYNVLHDCYDPWGIEVSFTLGIMGIIYLDAGTCNVDLRHNLLWAAPGSLQQALYFNTACVDIRESDNAFHKEFTRSCAELKPADFPGGQPFRFGHDFQNRPPLPKWPQLETARLAAANCDELSAGAVRSPVGLTGLKDGDWFAFHNVNFGQSWQSAVLRFASDVSEMNADVSAARRQRAPPDDRPVGPRSRDARGRFTEDQTTVVVHLRCPRRQLDPLQSGAARRRLPATSRGLWKRKRLAAVCRGAARPTRRPARCADSTTANR